MPIQIPVTQTGLEASIEAAAKKAGRSLKINMGGGAKSIEGLSQPLGRITGRADQFTKSMEAANARVLAFGASVGVLSAVSRGFKELVTTTIEVEKSLASINSILGTTSSQLNKFKQEIFEVARNTEQSFSSVANAALELSRQGLKAEEVTNRLNDSLVLSRLSGLGATEAVAGLTAAINSFNATGITSAEVLNKLSAAAVSAAVSEKDLIEGIKRSGSVAIQAGVSFDELVGVITAVQAKTARGGAVIGNSFKTIYTRIQSIDKLKTMQNLGVEVTDASGEILSATKLIQNLASVLGTLPNAEQLQIAEGLVGKFQIAPFLAILDDYNQKTSVAIKVTEVAAGATTEAYTRNVALNQTLSAAINSATVSVKELANTLGEIGVTDSLRNVLNFFNSLVSNIQKTLEGEGLGSDFARGIVKGIGNILSGPGLAIFAAVIAKLTIDLARFGFGSLKTFFGLNMAAKEQAALQGQIASTLLNNSSIQKQIMTIENSTLSIEQKRVAQTKFFTVALNEQMAVMQRMQSIAARVAPGVRAGTRGRGAGGYIPNFNAVAGYGSEQGDINRGVGGAPRSARPVTIPNFNFGGGQKGTMVANTSEYMVPNFAGSGGSAIFNQNMVGGMGLPAGATKIGAAGGYVPNFARAAKRKAVAKNLNLTEELVLFVGDRGKDQKKSIWTGQVGGKTQAYTSKILAEKANALNISNVNVPIYRLRQGQRDKEPKDVEYIKDRLSTTASQTADKFAKSLTGKQDLPSLTKKQISKLFNPGAFEGFAGSIFEVSLAAILGSKQFLDYASRTQTSRIDLPYSGRLFGKFGARGRGRRGAEVKANAGTELVKGAAIKFYDILGLGGAAAQYKDKRMGKHISKPMALSRYGIAHQSYQAIHKKYGSVSSGSISQWRLGRGGIPRGGAEGYIPNFASPLRDAVEREIGAGLPINQVRINQDATLRGAANPMGLAVTNMRDEPTGSIPAAEGYIPNFKKSMGDTAGGGFSSMVSSMLGLQIAFSMLSPIVGEVSDGNKTLAGTMKALNIAMIAMIAAQSLSSLGPVLGGLKNMAGTFVGKGAWATKGKALQGLGASRMVSGTNMARGVGGAAWATKAGRPVAGGLLKLGGIATKVGGALLRFAGPVGIGVTAIMAASWAFKKISGSADTLKIQQNVLGDATKYAAKELGELEVPEEFKKGKKAQAEAKAKGIIERIDKDRNIRGGNDKGQFAALEGLLSKAFLSSADPQYINKLMSDWKNSAVTKDHVIRNKGGVTKVAGGKARSFTQSEMRSITSELKDVVHGSDSDRRTKGAITGMSDEQLADWKKMREFELRIDREGTTSFGEIMNKGRASEVDLRTEDALINPANSKDEANYKSLMHRQKTREMLGNIATSTGPFGIDSETFIASGDIAMNREIADRAERKAKADEKSAKFNRIATDAYQETVKSAIAMALLDRTALDDLNEKIMIAEKLGGLTDQEISDLKIKQIEQTKIEKTNKNILKTAGAIAKFAKRVNVDGEKQKELLAAIAGYKSDGVISDIEKDALLKLAVDINEDITDSMATQLQSQYNSLSAEDKALEKLTAKLVLEERITEQARQQASLRKGAGIDATSRDAENTFGKKTVFQEIIDEERILQDNLRGNVRPTAAAGEELERAQAASNLRKLAAEQGQARLDLEEGARSRGASVINQLGERLANLNLGGSGVLKELTGETLTEGKSVEEVRARLKEVAEKVGKGEGDAGVVASLNSLHEELDRDVKSLEASEEANTAAAQSALKFAGVLKLASQPELFRGVKRNLLVGRNQSLLDARLETDSFARIKANMSNNNYDRKQDASEEEYRAILEEEQFAFKLVDASATFANNIGNAMVDAIAKGKSLGDSLRSAASDFFLMLSKAFMQKAINNLAGLGTGSTSTGGGTGLIGSLVGFLTGGGKNSGGIITGGSGARDDVPTMLTGGEFVMRRGAVARYGSDFMESLNRGSIQTMQRGGLFTPGTYGQESITGKKDLFNFATQGFTTGQQDRIGGGAGFGYAAMEPHSVRMTRWGIKNSRLAQSERGSQEEALGLYFRQLDKEKQEKEQKKAQKDALKAAFISMVAMAAISGATGGFGKGADKGKKPKWWQGILSGSGDVDPKKKYGWGSNGASMDGSPGVLTALPKWNRAAGGAVPYAAGIDTVPTMLSGGEFVMNAAATQNIGRGNLASMNSGAGGRDNRDVVGKLDELIDVSGDSGETVINITVNSDGTVSQDGTNAQEQQQNLAMKIKDQVRQVIDEEKRLGGSLRPARA